MSIGKLLIIEDEASIQELLVYTTRQAGFDALCVSSAELGMRAIDDELPVLVLIDVMLPGMSGVDLARRIRASARTRDLPIIMVTARGEEIDRVRGLELGADDYVTKPFSPKELVARIGAVLRRRTPHRSNQVLDVGPLHLDPLAHTAEVEGRQLDLGPTEYRLLHFLMASPNRVYSRDQLLNALRGDHAYLEDRTIDVYIRRLRAALGIDHQNIIETVRGAGYKLAVKG